MPIQRIFNELLAKGIEIAGDKPKANLAGILSRDKEHFEYRKPDGWWLVGVPEPEVGSAVEQSVDTIMPVPDVGPDENEDFKESSDAKASDGSNPSEASCAHKSLLSFPARAAA